MQGHLHGRHLLVVGIVHAVFVVEQLVGAGNLLPGERLSRGDVGIGGLLAVILKRGGHQPSILVDKHLVHAHLVADGAVVEFRVINQIGAAVGGSDDRVVALGTFAHGHESPVVVGTHDFLTSPVAPLAIVHLIGVEDGVHVARVLVGAVGLVGAEHTHLVAAVGREETVADEEVIVVADMLDIGTFARYIVSAGDFCSEIRVGGHTVAVAVGRGIADIIVSQTCLLIQLEHPDTARP